MKNNRESGRASGWGMGDGGWMGMGDVVGGQSWTKSIGIFYMGGVSRSLTLSAATANTLRSEYSKTRGDQETIMSSENGSKSLKYFGGFS